MKRALILASFLAWTSSPARAEWGQGAQSLTLYTGANLPLSKLTVNGTASSHDVKIAGFGLPVGGQYIFYVAPQFGVGLDISYTSFGSKETAGFLSSVDGKSKLQTTKALAIAKYSLPTDGMIWPYVLGGLGLYASSLRIDGTPSAGATWSNTGTTESRKLLDDSRTNLALTAGAGVDIPLSAHLLAGLEGRYLYLPSSTYSPTAAGRASGLTNVHGALSMVELLAKLGFRF